MFAFPLSKGRRWWTGHPPGDLTLCPLGTFSPGHSAEPTADQAGEGRAGVPGRFTFLLTFMSDVMSTELHAVLQPCRHGEGKLVSVLFIVSPLRDFGRKVEDVYGNKMNVSVSTGLLPQHSVCRGKLNFPPILLPKTSRGRSAPSSENKLLPWGSSVSNADSTD